MLFQAGLIECGPNVSLMMGEGWIFRQLTWQGHDFIDAVRDPEVWRRTKDGAPKVGGWTFGLIKDLGTAYVKHLVKERLGLDL